VAAFDSSTIVADSALALYDAPLWNMALIASRLHLVWIATVCGKLETRYRYSNTLGWNTFPVPTLTEKNKADLTACAEAILLAREAHLNDAVPLEGLLAGALFGWVFIAPLLFYALGGILGFVLRLVVPGTEGFDVRLAVFWALLVASPLVLLHGLAMGVIGTGAGVSLTFVIVVAVFMVVLVAGLRVALEAAAARA